MRIPIREQLALLILLSSLIGLGVISIATWVSNHSFVLSICKARLSLTASLKASQMASNLDLMQTTGNLVSTRVIIQQALMRYNDDGNNTVENWAAAEQDMSAVIGAGNSPGQALLLQTTVIPKNASGPAGDTGVIRTTSATATTIKLPLGCPDGSTATLGMSGEDCGGLPYGYPPELYPNTTFTSIDSDGTDVQQFEYNGVTIGPLARAALLIGPWRVNDTFSIVSLTVPIINNTSALEVLGWLTVVMDGRLIEQVLDNTDGLEKTGETLLLGPTSSTNLFPPGTLYSSAGKPPEDFPLQYIIPLNESDSGKSRHPDHTEDSPNLPFQASKYPALKQAITEKTGQQDNSGAMVKARNEAGKKVAVGYAMPQNDMVDWLVVVEQARSEVWKPINHLRDVLLACIFGTMGFMAIIAFPMAHFAVMPIRRLRDATTKSIEPPGNSDPSRSSFDSLDSERGRQTDGGEQEAADGTAVARKEGYTNPVTVWTQKRRKDRDLRREERRKRAFRIPGKVKERNAIVKDELSDLTGTFNEMSDELMMQYSRLEERVQQRTEQLEQSKKAAEAANESKTLFIANISHELKTPLNGILGMCAVCMHEDDPLRVKRSLGIIYKSGDLLLNLLTDLLTFSKNQVGQQLSLDEKEFRLRDVSSQILAVFDKQAKEGKIELRVVWEGVDNLTYDSLSQEPITTTSFGPNGTGRLKDMILWGDLQRILQVVINLVSNALKFTPSGGSVVLTIRCLPDTVDISRKTSMASRQSRAVSSRHKGSDTSSSGVKIDTATAINAKSRPHALAAAYERAASPPPGQFLYFEFEVMDTGPGIPENLQAKIFEPFVQGDLGLSKKFGGTGLGLSICSQLAGLMRGTIGVRSTPGVGSTFGMKIPLRHLKSRADSSASSSVDLPADVRLSRTSSMEDTTGVAARHSRLAADEVTEVRSSPEKATPAGTPALGSDSQPRLVGLSQPFFAASQPLESPGSQPAAIEKIEAEATRSGNKIRVLVAEDNKVNQEVVLRMLKLEDIYDVTVAKDGQEALDYVKESMTPPAESPTGEKREPFNLIFMDVQMPNVDGLQSTRLIREIGYQAPIVALTAFAEESNIKDCYDSGMNYFLSKPIRRPQLKKVLKEYCAPIPEENEEAEEVSRRASAAQTNTTVVLVNRPSVDTPMEAQQNGLPKEGFAPPVVPLQEQNEIKRPESPVSPLTNA